MASVLLARGDADGARTRLEKALAVFEKAYGPDNPATRRVSRALAALLKK
jgi:hypothetical protein